MSLPEWLGGSAYPFARAAIVYTKTDRTYRGVLWQRRAGYLVLREARELKGRGQELPLDGELLVDGSNVEYIQLLGSGV